MRLPVLILAPLLMAAAACASGEEAAAPAPTVTVTATATATETVTETPEPPELEEPAVVGETVEFADVSVTLHRVDLDPAPEPGPQPERDSDKWVAIDVELCSHTMEGLVSNDEWALADTDNRIFGPSRVGYGTFPNPGFAMGEEQIMPGECRRGWITFAVNEASDLVMVAYDATTFPGANGPSATWAVDS